MSLETYQKEVEHLGESQGVKDHDHDMIHDLSRRLDALWRYDQYIANAFVKVPEPSKSFFIATPEQGMERIYQTITKVLTNFKGIGIFSSNQIERGSTPSQKLVAHIRSAEVLIAICNNEQVSSKPNPYTMYALGIATSLGKPLIVITDDKDTWMKNSLLCIEEDKILECKSLEENSLEKFLEDFESKVKQSLDKIQPPFLIEKGLDDIKVRYWDDIQCTYPVFISDFFTILDFVEDIYYYFPDLYSLTKQMLEIVKEIEEASNSLEPNSFLAVNTRIESFAGKWIEYSNFFERVKQSFCSIFFKYQIDVDQAFESFIREANADMRTVLQAAFDNYKILKERLLGYPEFHDDVICFFQQHKDDKESPSQIQEEEKEKQNIRNVLINRTKTTRIYGSLEAYVKGTGAIIEKTHEIMIKLLQVIEHRSGRNELRKHFPGNQKEA